jgi:hypothetical protein
MTPDDAKLAAINYAWGREDAGGGPTVTPPGALTGYGAFSTAYANAWNDYNTGRRGMMIPVRDAWENWQASGGRSVFKQGELTLTDADRAELRTLWPTSLKPESEAAELRTAYWTRQEQMQAAAWEATAPAEAQHG